MMSLITQDFPHITVEACKESALGKVDERTGPTGVFIKNVSLGKYWKEIVLENV